MTAETIATERLAGAPQPAPPSPGSARRPDPRLRRALRGRAEDPTWARPGLLALLLGSALLYVWQLGDSGWANAYYSAAAQAAGQSWKALFFGSLDASSSITVDKTPASLWLMGLSTRVFGVSAWSILVPHALCGVASVGVLFATVRRTYGPAAGLTAGAVLATTPVAALMFRFNNPDALLVLLLVAGAYAVTRAVEVASARWIALAGVLVGFGFLTKMLQALLVVPAFALTYLIAAPTSLRRRLVHLLGAGVAMVLAAGWWIAAVTLWPASSRPYIGGSQGNSILELTLGYNGLGRLNGDETGSVGGGNAGQTGRWGETGWGRLFNADFGGQASWLLPAALVFLVGLLWRSRRHPRTDVRRAGLILWGSWLVVTGLVLSFAQGIIHSYYTVALAPAIGALVAIGAASTLLFAHRRHPVARVLGAAVVAVTAFWAFELLGRAGDWHGWLRPTVLFAGIVAAAGLLLADRLADRALAVVTALALTAALAGPFAFSLATAATPHTGALPSAGPASAATGPGGRFGGPGGAPPGGAALAPGTTGTQPQANRTAGGLGGLLDSSVPDSELAALLRADASSYSWVAATVGANNAAGLQLGTGQPVMAIGGFNGTDPSPTLAQFRQLVTDGKVHYFVAGGGMGGGMTGATSTGSEIASWVAQTFTATTVGGTTVYDLTTG